MTCNARIWNLPDGLVCIRKDPHETGHIYHTVGGEENHKDARQEDQEDSNHG